jgi:cell wall-associated NlpC family hydrolase
MTFQELIGMPYARGGRGPDTYDCAGLVVEMMRRRGIILAIPETPEAKDDQIHSMREILSAQWIEVPKAFPGCVVAFRGGHVGVMVSQFKFIHTGSEVGQVCIERLEGPVWPKQKLGFYEYGGPQ